MSATDRQNRLLVAEDWKRIYQTFRNADFQSYDFENLRRVMINYIRENYPEDFNDYIESSEYLALIDLIAFLGQSISFRTDLNARENFLELAERRDSVLRLARLLSYNPKRNIAGSGLLKFTAVQTTQTVVDSNGRNLVNQVIGWNDPANANWYDQFIKIINAALPASRQFGNPDDKADIYNIPTEQYRFQAANVSVPVYAFAKAIDGRNMSFEVVSTTFKGAEEIYEEPPAIGNRLGFVYRNDGRGAGSTNSGFFLHFRQGILNQGTFTIDQPATNETVDLDSVNINNTDVWLYRLNQTGVESEYWAKVPSLEGNNIIYNSLNKSIKNIYNVTTRSNDRISLAFSDGTFGNLPRGTFRVYYRASNGISYTINPRDVKNVVIEVPYVSNVGQAETLTLTLSLQTSVSNSTEAESNTSIKNNAPSTYYTQNRMITAEDYNLSPLGINQEVIKVKAVNRSASGISRYFDLVDPTGKYSKTNLFGDDGALYKEEYTSSFRFNYTTRTDIEAVIYNQVYETLKTTQLRDFYYSKFSRVTIDNITWYSKTVDTNQSTGFVGSLGVPSQLGTYTNTNLRFVTAGVLLKFTAPPNKYFNKSNDNKLETINPAKPAANSTDSLWVKVISVVGDGTNGGTGVVANGSGTVILNDIVPETAILSEIIPAWKATINSTVIATMVDLIFSNKPFGLRYDTETATWKIVFEVNLNTLENFSTANQGNNSNQQRDASWLILFTTNTEFYTVTSRLIRYIFESDKQIRFFFDASDKIYDTRTNTIVKDKIKVLGINTAPPTFINPFTYDREWEITEEYTGLDGYVDTKKIQVTFSDTDDDSVVDNPELFEEIVDQMDVQNPVSDNNKYVILERYVIAYGQEDYKLFNNSNGTVTILDTQPTNTSSYTTGQYFYFKDAGVVKQFNNGNFTLSLNYKVYNGRRDVKFQYIHNADYESRIDPGLTNIIDTFILTKQYDKTYRQWLAGSRTTEPLAPSTDYLYTLLSTDLNKIKSISDELIYHPVKYKVLFGEKASSDVQATFKIVKNSEIVISDNDVKSRVLSAINEFFTLENWDFGDSFYFSELSSYVMSRLTPNIVNFLIVPKDTTLSFGGLYEIRSEKDQIFINGATIDNLEIISAVTASKINSSGTITMTSSTLSTQSITSGSY
jgi:hypothetical protein